MYVSPASHLDSYMLRLTVVAYQLVYVCWLAFEFTFLWFTIVETKDRTLEETAALFDGEDALEQITHKALARDVHEDGSTEKRSIGQGNDRELA